MTASFRNLVLAITASFAWVASYAVAQDLTPTRSYLELTPKWAYLSIREVNDQRLTASIANVQGVPEDSILDLTEGYYLAFHYARDPMSGTSRLDRLLRVQVVEIESQQSIRLAVGRDAMKYLRPDGSLDLTRPLQSTTAQLRTLPDAIELQFTDEAELDKLLSLHRSVIDLKQLSLAMHDFQSVYDHFPPAVIYGPDGKPWHSWRVLLLPYLGENERYNAYDFTQPWDGPKNKQLAEQAPAIYRDGIYGDKDPGMTHFVAITGPGTAFPTEGMKLADDLKLNLSKTPGMTTRDDITDGRETTLLIGPAPADANIPWTKPEDLVVREKFPALGTKGGYALPYIFGKQRTGAFLLAGEGIDELSGVALTGAIAPNFFRALLTIGGGERIERSQLPQIGPLPNRPHEKNAVLEVDLTRDGAIGRLFVKNKRQQAR